VQAKVGQICVVTLEPIENEIDEEVDLIFAPADEIAPQIDADADDGEGAVAEPPEPIQNGIIDLGRLATDVLYLAIDPYPRKQGAMFEPPLTAVDPEDHPFAALKALQTGPGTSAPTPGKRKGK
jgi:Large ribosomal RNA subunit accumulation protein YceD